MYLPKIFYDTFSGYPSWTFKENKDKNEVIMAVPGLSKEDLEITVNEEERCLYISYEGEKSGDILYNHFKYCIPFSKMGDVENITSRLSDGMLTITIPLKAEGLRKIKIN